MTNTALHVVFTLSAAGSLREGLAIAGRNEEVVGLQDDWSQGPLDNTESECAIGCR
ncbi:DUF1835 domain-containing protein [Brevundimonas subvibrioides]|uniref:DUF1835 domain-containing protein n=1 Tax=Brevundimonas subvibrioides TaxID=74313 RepID=UPI0032D57399